MSIEKSPVARFRPWLSAILVALLPVLAAPSAQAYTLTPLLQDFTPTGRGSRAVFVVENDQAVPIAVEFTVKSRKVTPEGEEVLTDAEDDFGVFPQQMVIRPKQKQTVRVQWLGKNIPEKELQYRLILEQLPIETAGKPKEGVNINFLMRYLAFLAVVPPGAKGKLVVAPAEVIDAGGKRILLITIENQGNGRISPGNSTLALTPAGAAPIRISFEAHKEVAGESIAPGARRIFRIAAPPGLVPGKFPATLVPQAATPQ